MIIDCKNWQEPIEPFRGKCLLGKYNGRPVLGQCVFECEHCKTTEAELTEYMAELAAEQNKEQAEAIQKQKAEQAKAMAGLPAWFQQVKNLHKHAGQIVAHFAKTGRILVTPEQKSERLAICDDCEKLLLNPKTGNKRCSGCGCHLAEIAGIEKGKADFEALKCENWPDITLGG